MNFNPVIIHLAVNNLLKKFEPPEETSHEGTKPQRHKE
jgi:hypothetical protein